MKGRNIYERERGVWFMLPIQLFSIWIDKTLESPAASVNVTFWASPNGGKNSHPITITQTGAR